jgi:hypothetical protein
MCDVSDTSIPLLNELPQFEGLKDGVTVRFRGMVQDNLDRVLKHTSFGEFDLKHKRGLEGIPPDYVAEFSSDYYTVDRYIIVSIPGDAQFTPVSVDSVPQLFEECKSSSEKRDAMDIDCGDETGKRLRTTGDEEPPAMVPLEEPSSAPVTVPQSQHPLPSCIISRDMKRFSCLVSVCDSDLDLKLHELVDVVGVLHSGNNDEGPQVEFTLQAIEVKRVVPVVPEEVSLETVQEARTAILAVLEKITNDRLLAEYLLLHLVSRRIPGNEALPTMGSWTLNITHTQLDETRWDLLTSFIQRIVRAHPVVSVPAKNEILLKEQFYPIRHAEHEFTCPGILQMAENTTCVLDERHLEEGQVNSLNVLALSKAIKDQQLIGVFGINDSFINFPVDIKFLVLSREKSLFAEPSHPGSGIVGTVPFVTVKAKERTNHTITENDIQLTETDLKLIQDYLAHAQQLVLQAVTIAEETVNEFQESWVSLRKQAPEIPTDDIHIWATLLKSVAASEGATVAQVNHLHRLLNLESQRRNQNGLHTATAEFLRDQSNIATIGA